MALTRSDFEKYRVNEVLARREDDGNLTAWSYRSACLNERSLHEEAGNETGIELFTLLGNISSLLLSAHYMELDAPFEYMKDVNGQRRELTDLFDASQLDFLAAVICVVDDPIMRAQIGDVLWLCRHGGENKHKIAFLACDSYLESVKPEALTIWMENRLERALQLATLLNNPEKLQKGLCKAKEVASTRQMPGDWERMMVLLAKYSQQGRVEYIEQIWGKSSQVEEEGLYEAAIRFREDAIYLMSENKRHERAKEMRLELAETFVASAASDVANASVWTAFARAKSQIEQAIKHHKLASGPKKRLEELNSLLAYYSKKAADSMDLNSFEWEPDEELRDLLDAREKCVIGEFKGRPIEEALILLATFPYSIKADEIRKEAADLSQASVVSLFGDEELNQQGKTVSKNVVFSAGRNMIFRRLVHAKSVIQPAVKQITDDHEIKIHDIGALLERSRFVPQHSLWTFARGLLAGLEFDLVTVAHVLPPLIENALRERLRSLGVNTSDWNEEFISKERTLGWVLAQKEIEVLLGEDLLFDLRTLLLPDEGGLNIRNRVGHGLQTDGHYFLDAEGRNGQVLAQTVYLWWLALRLCLYGQAEEYFEMHKVVPNATNNNDNSSED